MPLFLQFFRNPELKPMFYDISSTIIVTDDMGSNWHGRCGVCHVFNRKITLQTSWQVHSEQWDHRHWSWLAVPSNWEGNTWTRCFHRHWYEIWRQIEAELVDSDQDVWCDNEIIDSVDPETGVVTYTNMCDENHERYLLWNLVVPSLIDDTMTKQKRVWGRFGEQTESNDDDDLVVIRATR